MLKNATSRILAKRHFWRYASFTELNELYVSNMLRAVAANLFSIFVPIFLLKSGYSLTWVSLYFVFYFGVRVFGDILSGLIVARIGPKHTWILSHTSNILNLVCLLGLSSHPALFWVSSLFNALGTSFQHIPLHIDFSKIKHTDHNGKEQSFFMTLDKIGSAVGPMLGGFIAAQYGANLTIIASIVLYIGSLIPLLSTPEPVKIKQHIKFKDFPLKKIWRDVISHSLQGVDTTVTAGMWPIFLVIVVFHNSVYQSVGLISTVSIVVAVFTTYLFGKIIDSERRLTFFRIASSINSLVYVARIFASSLVGALGVNLINESAYTGSMMAYNKGMYAAADDLPGYRIAYFTYMEVISEFAKGAMWLGLAGLTVVLSDASSLKIAFAFTGIATLGIMLERYKALRHRSPVHLL